MNTFDMFPHESVENFSARANPGVDQIEIAVMNYDGAELPAFDHAYFVTPDEVALKACTRARILC